MPVLNVVVKWLYSKTCKEKKMIKYRVEGPERWGKNASKAKKYKISATSTINCSVCKKKTLLSDTIRVWPDSPKSMYSWCCSEKCVTFLILSGKSEEDEKEL